MCAGQHPVGHAKTKDFGIAECRALQEELEKQFKAAKETPDGGVPPPRQGPRWNTVAVQAATQELLRTLRQTTLPWSSMTTTCPWWKRRVHIR